MWTTKYKWSYVFKPALGTQLDARPTGDQEVVGSAPDGSATFLREYLVMEYFLACPVNVW